MRDDHREAKTAKEQSLLDLVNGLQSNLIGFATGGSFEDDDEGYQKLRRAIRQHPDVYSRVPWFVRDFTTIGQFWSYVKDNIAGYQPRREFLWKEFAPVIRYLEEIEHNAGIVPVSEILSNFNSENVHAVWQKALGRKSEDPEGAITAARTLIETVCKHILDDCSVEYDSRDDLPRLWHMTAEQLNLAPSQQQELSFRRILGNCQSVVGYLSEIRNQSGDAHGFGVNQIKPEPRHAELAVNLAGTMAGFLVESWLASKN